MNTVYCLSKNMNILGYELQYVNLGFDYQRTFTYICLDNDMFKKNQKYTVSITITFIIYVKYKYNKKKALRTTFYE